MSSPIAKSQRGCLHMVISVLLESGLYPDHACLIYLYMVWYISNGFVEALGTFMH